MVTLQSNAALKIGVLALLSGDDFSQKQIVSKLGYGKNFRPVYNTLQKLIEQKLVRPVGFTKNVSPIKPMYGTTADGVNEVLEYLEPIQFWKMVSFNLFEKKSNRIPITNKLFERYESAKELFWSEYITSPFQDTEIEPYADNKFLPDSIRLNEKLFLELIAISFPQSKHSIISKFEKNPHIQLLLKNAPGLAHALFTGFESDQMIEPVSDNGQKKFGLALRGLLLMFHYLSEELSDDNITMKINATLANHHHLVPEIFHPSNVSKLGMSNEEIVNLFNKIFFNPQKLSSDSKLTNFVIFSNLHKLKGNISSEKIKTFIDAFWEEQKKFPQMDKEKKFRRKLQNYYKIHFETFSARNTFALRQRIVFDFFLAYRELYPDKWDEVRDIIRLEKSSIGKWHDKCICQLADFSSKKQKALLDTLKS